MTKEYAIYYLTQIAEGKDLVGLGEGLNDGFIIDRVDSCGEFIVYVLSREKKDEATQELTDRRVREEKKSEDLQETNDVV